MTPGVRKFALTIHLVCSVGWIGAVVAYLALGAAAVTSQDGQTVRAAWIGMEVTGWWAIAPRRRPRVRSRRASSQQASTPTAGRSAALASAPTSSAAVEPRTELLKRANAASAGKDLSRAQTLYGRVINASPSASESAAQTRALTGFAEFRLLLTLIGRGSEQDAQQLVQRLRSANADSPFTGLATDFWDQYGMTASIAAACASITSEVARQATSPIAELQRLGVAASPRELCIAPGA
jgi:hypothetical protein